MQEVDPSQKRRVESQQKNIRATCSNVIFLAFNGILPAGMAYHISQYCCPLMVYDKIS